MKGFQPKAGSLGSASGKPRKPKSPPWRVFHPRNRKTGEVLLEGYLRATLLFQDYDRERYEAVAYLVAEHK
jgi:hypothetical protein